MKKLFCILACLFAANAYCVAHPVVTHHQVAVHKKADKMLKFCRVFKSDVMKGCNKSEKAHWYIPKSTCNNMKHIYHEMIKYKGGGKLKVACHNTANKKSKVPVKKQAQQCVAAWTTYMKHCQAVSTKPIKKTVKTVKHS